MGSLIGIMGGMFDPVHEGHIKAATSALRQCGLESIIFIPCGTPVHKEKSFSSGSHRCEMLRLAIADKPNFSLDTRECDSKEPSWTVNTISALKQERGDDVLCFILGMDAFLGFDSWYKWREIMAVSNLLIITRPNYSFAESHLSAELLSEFKARKITLNDKLELYGSGKILMLEGETPALSSSQIRECLLDKKEVDTLLPKVVRRYILDNQLYRKTEL